MTDDLATLNRAPAPPSRPAATVAAAGLVGNVGQTEGTALDAANSTHDQAFTTGTNTPGYTLTSVEVRMASTALLLESH